MDEPRSSLSGDFLGGIEKSKVIRTSASVYSDNRNNAWKFNPNNGNFNNNNRNDNTAVRCVGR